MFQKPLFKRIALSTMLMTAVVSPTLMANAAEVPPGPDKQPVLTAAFTSATIAVKAIQDPVKLAEQYAPETVEDWKTTLAAYQEATGIQAPSITLEAVKELPLSGNPAEPQAVLVQAVPVELGKVELPDTASGTFTIVTGAPEAFKLEALPTSTPGALKLDKLPTVAPGVVKIEALPISASVAKAATTSALKPVALPSSTSTQVTMSALPTAAPVDFEVRNLPSAGTISLQPAGTIPTAVPAAAFHISGTAFSPELAKGWEALDQAVQSADSESIKSALSAQLELYVQQIAKLAEEKEKANS